MGFLFGSDEENIDTKMVETTGSVNNNIIVQEAADTHSAMMSTERLLFATYLLVGSEILKLSIYIFHVIRKHLKKKYTNK